MMNTSATTRHQEYRANRARHADHDLVEQETTTRCDQATEARQTASLDTELEAMVSAGAPQTTAAPFSTAAFADDAASRLLVYEADWDDATRGHVIDQANVAMRMGIVNPRVATTTALMDVLSNQYGSQVRDRLDGSIPTFWTSSSNGRPVSSSPVAEGLRPAFNRDEVNALREWGHQTDLAPTVCDPEINGVNRWALAVDPIAPPISALCTATKLISNATGEVLAIEVGRHASYELLATWLPGRQVRAASSVYQVRPTRSITNGPYEAVIVGIPSQNAMRFALDERANGHDDLPSTLRTPPSTAELIAQALNSVTDQGVVVIIANVYTQGDAYRELAANGWIETSDPVVAMRTVVPMMPAYPVPEPDRLRVVRAYTRRTP